MNFKSYLRFGLIALDIVSFSKIALILHLYHFFYGFHLFPILILITEDISSSLDSHVTQNSVFFILCVVRFVISGLEDEHLCLDTKLSHQGYEPHSITCSIPTPMQVPPLVTLSTRSSFIWADVDAEQRLQFHIRVVVKPRYLPPEQRSVYCRDVSLVFLAWALHRCYKSCSG